MHKIADLPVLYDIDEKFLHNRFTRFISDDTEPILQYRIEEGQFNLPEGAERSFQSETFDIYRLKDGWLVKQRDQTRIPYAVRASRYWDRATLYISPQSKEYIHSLKLSKQEEEEGYRLLILSGLMECFRFAVLPFRRLYVHGVLMEYADSGFIFSARSGTGKTTHTDLWVKRYGARILDGDNTVIDCNKENPVAYGLPWCGSSQLFENEKTNLKGIVFLEQAPVNEAHELEMQEAILRLLPRCFLPTWDEDMMGLALDTCGAILSSTKAYILRCRPDYESVEVIKQCLNI